MNKRYWFLLIFVGVSIAFAGIASTMGANFWVALAIAIGALLVNGLFATLEDDLPGGFNNPEGTATPKYVGLVAWSVRAVGVVCLALIAVVLGFWAYASR